MFEYKLKNTYDIESQDDMTCINDNEVSDIDECNILHDILNPPNCSKSKISITVLFYIDVWIQKEIDLSVNVLILWDSGFS